MLYTPLISFYICAISVALANQPAYRPAAQRNVQLIEQRNNKVWCTQDSLVVYDDCRMCVCPRPNRIAKCFKKTCDLRTKNSGQCPPATMKMNDNALCPSSMRPACKQDKDCPGQQICCFDFCKGAQCVNPMPLDSGAPIQAGRRHK